MTPEQKAYIDDATYQLLASHWTWGYVGDPIFQGEAGEYFARALLKKRTANTKVEIARIKKAVNWINGK